MTTPGQTHPNLLPVPKWTLIIHAVQGVFAIIILGLDAYGIRWIAYNALIFSLVVCILTLGAVAYALGTQLFLHNLYNKFIFLGIHILMLIFWIVDLGLVANLARIWASPSCGYSYYYTTYYCSYYRKRDIEFHSLGVSGLEKRDTTTTGAYYGALAAGAFFAAMEFGLWVASLVILLMYINKDRTNTTTTGTQQPSYGADQAVALSPEKYGQTGQPQQPYSTVSTPAPQYAQPVPQQGAYAPPPVPQQQGQYPQPTYAQPQAPQYPTPYNQHQDPINRGATVSPVSAVAYNEPPPHASELQTPQSTGGYANPNVSELGSQNGAGYNPNASELSSHK